MTQPTATLPRWLSMTYYPEQWRELKAIRLMQHVPTGYVFNLDDIGWINPLWFAVWRVRLYHKARAIVDKMAELMEADK